MDWTKYSREIIAELLSRLNLEEVEPTPSSLEYLNGVLNYCYSEGFKAYEPEHW